MKIATYNVNSIGARLPVLLRWLATSKPDVACLQELKGADEKFPIDAIREAGYEAVWHGQKAYNGVAILARGETPQETRRGLPGDPDDTHSRYIEAVVGGITVGCLYLPNGNPAPGPKFDYKLRWFERFNGHAGALLEEGRPGRPRGRLQRHPHRAGRLQARALGRRRACSSPSPAKPTASCSPRAGRTRSGICIPRRRSTPSGTTCGERFTRNAGLRIDHLLLSPELAPRLKAAGVDRDVRALEKTSDHAPTWIELAEG